MGNSLALGWLPSGLLAKVGGGETEPTPPRAESAWPSAPDKYARIPLARPSHPRTATITALSKPKPNHAENSTVTSLVDTPRDWLMKNTIRNRPTHGTNITRPSVARIARL